MSDTTYQGWSNYATRTVNLWLSNDEGDYRFWTATARQALSDHDGDSDAAARYVADAVRETLGEMADASGVDGVLGDLLSGAIDDVDCEEVAQSWVGDVYDDWAAKSRE